MAKKPTKTMKSRTAKKPPAKPDTKQNIVLAMLRRANGASVAEIIEVRARAYGCPGADALTDCAVEVCLTVETAVDRVL